MSNIVELLKKNSDLEKQAYSEYVKHATSGGIAVLVSKGLPFEKAASLVKQACAESEELRAKEESFTLLEKAAEYLAELESKVFSLTKQAENASDVEIKKAPLEKLSSLGFTQEELDALRKVDSGTGLLDKVANVHSTPWGMGKAAGVVREKTDPLLEFILSA